MTSGRSFAAIPTPVSLTRNIANRGLGADPVSRVTLPPAGVNFTALLSRLTTTWPILSASALTSTGVRRRFKPTLEPAKAAATLSAASAAIVARS
ncbi:MAG TPA: hypothetical protein VF506_18365 [Streptosporangiaceae bacterium]